MPRWTRMGWSDAGVRCSPQTQRPRSTSAHHARTTHQHSSAGGRAGSRGRSSSGECAKKHTGRRQVDPNWHSSVRNRSGCSPGGVGRRGRGAGGRGSSRWPGASGRVACAKAGGHQQLELAGACAPKPATSLQTLPTKRLNTAQTTHNTPGGCAHAGTDRRQGMAASAVVRGVVWQLVTFTQRSVTCISKQQLHPTGPHLLGVVTRHAAVEDLAGVAPRGPLPRVRRAANGPLVRDPQQARVHLRQGGGKEGKVNGEQACR